ncbi:MAG TPA: beta-ketoacyl-ACP synthase III [Propionibacteriaceae bacterium]|nr:beta-ketoacyl-ACP synthase III [Propionibacteriaceae bacterium]
MTIATRTGSAGSRILGIGAYRPRRVVDNAEICTMIDSSDEWIQTRSGIKERRWASEDETIQMMSVSSARKAIQRAGLQVGQIDTIIVATVTHLYQTPAAAAMIAFELGAAGAAAFDISAACAGFCYGIAMADSLIRTGAARHVLVVGVERLSDLTDPTDRSTAFIFADGAGAAVVGPSETTEIGPVVWGSDGGQADLITQNEPWNVAMAAEDPHVPVLKMNGNPVFKWAAYTMAKAAAEALDAAGVRPEDLEVFVPHQANMRITDAMFRALKLPANVVVGRDIARQGNTSAASIPLALEALLDSGEARSGQTCLIIGFGAGLVYAGQVITLP